MSFFPCLQEPARGLDPKPDENSVQTLPHTNYFIMSIGRYWSSVKGWRHFLLARNFDVNLASGSRKVRCPCCVQWRRCYVI